MKAVSCGDVQMMSKVRCDLAAGHEDSHIHFGDDGTTAWGWKVEQRGLEWQEARR